MFWGHLEFWSCWLHKFSCSSGTPMKYKYRYMAKYIIIHILFERQINRDRESLLFQSTAISDVIYNYIDWINYNKPARIRMLLMMIRSQKPLTFNAAAIGDMSIDTFKRVVLLFREQTVHDEKQISTSNYQQKKYTCFVICSQKLYVKQVV